MTVLRVAGVEWIGRKKTTIYEVSNLMESVYPLFICLFVHVQDD